MSLQPLVSLYRYALTPVAPFTWFGLPVSSLDLVAVFRLCYILRSVREILRNEHTKRRAADTKLPPSEDRSFARDALTVLTIVYGGEAIAAPLLGVPASFMISGVGPLLCVAIQALVNALPYVPPMAPNSELPLSFIDGHTRAMLLCTLAPRLVLNSPSPAVSTSPWALLLSSLIITNGGMLVVNLVALLHPTPLALSTPAELLPYGWTTTDLWSAPLVTGIYATLTHSQPYWADVHAVIAGLLGAGGKVDPVDPETARSACALILAVLFSFRTANKFGLIGKRGAAQKIKTN